MELFVATGTVNGARSIKGLFDYHPTHHYLNDLNRNKL